MRWRTQQHDEIRLDRVGCDLMVACTKESPTPDAGWYVDGAQTCATSQGVNTNPVFLMLNTAVGGAGSWPGAPDQTTVFPNYLDIDYVRVYQ